MKSKALLIVFMFILALTLAPAVTAADKPITLRLAHFLWEQPEMAGSITEKFFASEVEKRTNGKVKIELYWAGQLGQTKELLGLVRNGTVDMAAFPAGYFPAEFPLWRAPNSIPFVMTKIDQVAEVSRRLPREIPAIQDEMKKNNIKFLYCHTIETYQLFAKKPIIKVEDFKGMRVRTWGIYLPQAFAAVGGVGVSVFPTEAYESLKRGVTDAQIWSVSNGAMLKIEEVAADVCLWDIMAIVGWQISMNLDKWNELPKDVQDVILKVADECFDYERQRANKVDAGAREMLTKKGVKFHEIPKAERDKWLAVCPDFMGSWIQDNEKLGFGAAAKQMRDLWLEIVKKY